MNVTASFIVARGVVWSVLQHVRKTNVEKYREDNKGAHAEPQRRISFISKKLPKIVYFEGFFFPKKSSLPWCFLLALPICPAPVASPRNTCRIAELKVLLSVQSMALWRKNNLHSVTFLWSILWVSHRSHRSVWLCSWHFQWMTFPKLSQVHVKISVPKGIKFVGHPGKHHLTRKKCVAPGEAKPTSIVLSFNELGLSNITGSTQLKAACWCLEGFYKCFFWFLSQEKILISLLPQFVHSICCQLGFSTSFIVGTNSLPVMHRMYNKCTNKSGDSLFISFPVVIFAHARLGLLHFPEEIWGNF